MIRNPEDREMVRGIYTLLLAEARDAFEELGDREAAEQLSHVLGHLDAAHRDSHPNQVELQLGG